MTDHFARLDEPRRPWIEGDRLEEAFLTRSRETHPDHVAQDAPAARTAAQEKFTALNAAHQCLREPRARARHLLELERGTPLTDVHSLPDSWMDVFLAIARQCEEIDAFLAAAAGERAPMLRLARFEEAMALSTRLDLPQKQLESRRAGLWAELKGLNAAWETAPPPGDPRRAEALPLAELERILRELSHVDRWNQQVRERTVRLTLLA